MMQVWKTHPFISKLLEGGELLEYGAKTIPEGGWNSIPKTYGENFLIVGDRRAGFLSTLKLNTGFIWQLSLEFVQVRA